MKPLINFILILVLCCSLISGCQDRNAKSVESDKSTASDETIVPSSTATPSQKIAIDDTVMDRDNHVTIEDPSIYGANRVNVWLLNKYGSSTIKDAKIEYISRAVFDQLSDSFQISPILYSVSFFSQKAIPGAEKQPDDSYKFKC